MVTSQQLDIIYDAVQRYTERIHLVQQAMREMRPVMLQGLPPNGSPFDEVVEYCRQIELVPWRGFWRDADQVEWRYAFHGGGLRLIHLVTNEPLDWDADMDGDSDLDAFDLSFFGTWFGWYVSSDPEVKAAFPARAAFEHLITQGLVSKHGNLYKVVKPSTIIPGDAAESDV